MAGEINDLMPEHVVERYEPSERSGKPLKTAQYFCGIAYKRH